MKYYKIILFLSVFMSLTFASCTKEKTTSELIIGSWINTSKSYVENNPDGVIHRYPIVAGELYYDFKSDGTGICINEGDGYTFTYKIQDNKIIIDDDWIIYEIKEISESKLVLEETGYSLDDMFYETHHYEFERK